MASGENSASVVRLAWSAEDADAETLAVEGGIRRENRAAGSTAERFTFTTAGDAANSACVVALGVGLLGGRSHVVRVTGTSPAARGAYLSICVAGDPTRELLPAESATLAWDGSGRTAMQIAFAPPADGQYDVRVRLRGTAALDGPALALRRVLLVERPPVAAVSTVAPSGASIFPDLRALRSERRVLEDLASAAVLTNEAEARYARRVGAGQALVLGVVARDVGRPLSGSKPAVDLRSLYGPAGAREQLLDHRRRFRLNMAAGDLSRDAYGAPLVADIAVDDSYLDAQFQVLLMRFHNRVMDHFANANAQQGITSVSDAQLFDRARACVVTHWQWAVLYDTVRSLVDDATFKDVCGCGQRFFTVYKPSDAPKVPPAEFTHALAHLARVMRRDTYPLARVGVFLTERQARYYVHGVLPPAPLDMHALFDPDRWPAGAVDSYVARSTSLSARARGTFHGAPRDPEAHHGRRVHSPLEAPIAEDELRRADRTGVYRSLGVSARRLPLLPYVLKEAEIREDGQRLTGVGARLLVELVRGFIWSAPRHLCCLANDWRPSLPRARSETYGVRDIVTWTLRPTNSRAPVHDEAGGARLVISGVEARTV